MSILFFVISGLMFVLALKWLIDSAKRPTLEGAGLAIQWLIASGIFAIAGVLA